MSGEPRISVRLKGHIGVFGLDMKFDAPAHGITAVHGPSGAGKTSLLRAVAGLERLTGDVRVGGKIWQDSDGAFRATESRAVGYVFQETSLFPHLSVRGNLLYGQRRARRRGRADHVPFDDVVALMGISHLMGRATPTLSGGERQRVAIGRALLAQPRLLLMDEPLAALDAAGKAEILPYLEALHDSLSIPLLYVSHDMSEIERLADTLVLIEHGRVLAYGPLSRMLADTSLPVARGPLAVSVAEARISGFDTRYDLTEMHLATALLRVPGHVGEPGEMRRIRIAAADVSLARERPSLTSILNVLPVIIESIDPLGSGQVNVLVNVGDSRDRVQLLARISRRAHDLLGLEAGQEVYAQVKAVSLVASDAGAQ